MWKLFSSKIFKKSNTKNALAVLVGGSSIAYLAPKFYNNNFGLKSLHAKEENENSRTAIIIGAGVMGLTTALQLSERGYKVTILEKANSVASVASYTNGAIICPSMCASWANMKLFSKNTGELKGVKMTWAAISDVKFWRWGFWFVLNSLWPGKPEHNHHAQRVLGKYSLECLRQLELKYGEELDMNKSTENTIKLFDVDENLTSFFESSQAKFWEDAKAPFKRLSVEECKKEIPIMVEDIDLIGGLTNDPAIDTNGDIFKFCVNVEKICVKKGVTIHKGIGVKKINLLKSSNGRRKISSIDCDDGSSHSGDVFVMATGIESAPLARKIGVNIPVYPMRGNILTIPLKEGQSNIIRNVYSPRNAVVISPLKPNLIRVSADVQAVGYDFSTDHEGCKKVMERTFRVLRRDLFDEDKAQFYSCLRPLCGDDVPIVGQTMVPNLYAITGHGSKGWTLSFGSAELLADIIEGNQTKIDPMPYSPKRFHLIRRYFTN